jgi:hypothetical protein
MTVVKDIQYWEFWDPNLLQVHPIPEQRWKVYHPALRVNLKPRLS